MTWLNRDVGPLRLTRWDTQANYERLGVRQLKRLYPEGGEWAGGKSKSRLPNLADSTAVDGYVVETRRAEWVHWIGCLSWLPVTLFAAWGVTLGLGVVTLVVNLIPIVIVRYNRLRLVALSL